MVKGPGVASGDLHLTVIKSKTESGLEIQKYFIVPKLPACLGKVVVLFID